MDYRSGQPRRIAGDHWRGPFPRAQGGLCDFRPVLTRAPTEADGSATVRAVYPSPEDEAVDGWVRVRW
jgi:hypothetical protein